MLSLEAPVFLTPAEEEVRVVLRALLARLLNMEQRRYSPLYVGPVRRVDCVLRALQEAAAQCGLDVFDADSATCPSLAEGVGFGSVRSIPAALASAGERRWVIAGDVDPDRLPSDFLACLDRDGLIYDTRQFPGPPAAPSPLREAIAHKAGVAGSWVLEVASDADAAPIVAAEAAVRLRLLGYSVSGVYEAFTDAALAGCAFSPAAGGRTAVVVYVGYRPEPGVVRQLVVQASAHGAGLVLVATAGTLAGLDLASHTAGSVVRAAPEPVPEAVRAASWLPAREVLTGAPESGAARELISQVEAHHRSLNHIIRAAASWERAGFLLVFGADRFGWIRLDGSEDLVRGAWRLGDADGATAEELLARVRAMCLWEGICALFVAATAPVPTALPAQAAVLVDTVDLDVRRTLDEARCGRVPVGSLAPPVAAVPPSRVARELLWWGQTRPAQELLEAAERASGWGVEEELLLGYLSAERDPREASARLQHAALRLADDLAGSRSAQHVDATFAALLLDVRAHPSRARHAWGVVERWLESQGASWVWTARRAAVAYEIAARVGALEEAGLFRDLVVQLSRPGDVLPAWVRTSDPLAHRVEQ
ncbi:MAG TPA: hypothetical protein VFR37_09690 [Longimicrobium sp.]|nr:hypothetical protein [Longimicrobium sp.]